MTDQKHIFLFGQTLPGNEGILLDRIRECAEKRNKGTIQPTVAIKAIAPENILQIAVGSNHIAFLLKDHRIARLPFVIVTNVVEPTISIDKGNDGGPSGSSNTGSVTSAAEAAASAAANAASRTAKIRRIMMARPGVRGSSGGFCRTGVIIDRNRSRPMIPASSVPEELIVQCQVVLQGKSRDIIVRELQRTNLNVNEAVNNLLSRDDDEVDESFETSEAYLHEELLSLLDAGLRSDGSGASALLDHENIYSAGDGYEYLISRDLARRREDGKSKDSSKDSENANVTHEQFILGETMEYWGDISETETQFKFPSNVNKFLKITSMHSELLALADDGRLYFWSWDKGARPGNMPHSNSSVLLSEDERIVDLESGGLRAVILTNNQKVGSFMDISCGQKLSHYLGESLVQLAEPISQLFCCTLFSAIMTKNGNIHWRGVLPFNERRKLWEKVRSSKKKQVTFDTSAEIVVGSEVRTKSTPIYSVGSIAVNFTGGLPLIGTLFEDAWTLNETCRFRVQMPGNYDLASIGSTDKMVQQQREKRVSFSLAGNRKRSAPPSATEEPPPPIGGAGTAAATSAESGGTNSQPISSASKESAWNLKDVIFIHEESVSDTSIVKIVDGAYCGVVLKSALEKLEKEGSSMDISKMCIRLMRKDDLMIVSSSSRSARAPENFQSQFKPIHLPASVNKVISLTVDSTGFRILCEKRSRVHLLRVNCLGKLLSDHQLPINLSSLLSNSNQHKNLTELQKEWLPSLKNFGDESILLFRDPQGAFQPLLRNAGGGFQELIFTGIGRVFHFGIGIRYFKSPNEINGSAISTEKISTGKGLKIQQNKNANRVLLVVALTAPCTLDQPLINSLMQSILNCDLNSVTEILNKLTNLNIEQRKAMVVERIDKNKNIFHVAVLNAYSLTNKDQADLDQVDTKSASLIDGHQLDNSEAEATKARYDRKWQEMLGSAPTTRAKAQAQQAAKDALKGGLIEAKDLRELSKDKSSDDVPKSSSESPKKIPVTQKDRQANAIEIIRELCKCSAVHEHFIELMQQKDLGGLTPFELAVQARAYSAAVIMWECAQDLRDWSQDITEILMSNGTDPIGEESSLFTLCANDTCSYTWTGEEHTPQDIFECKTCGLTGTLCCCTECAYTCHKNHDCKLKRTSPTAYCDCWEKCGCKALIVGNTFKREQLLQMMLQNGKLIAQLNSRGEHLLLFLAKTVSRQLVEQENFVRRSKRPGPGTTVTASGIRIPEHDLEPPKFARRALELVLSNWDAVKSLIEIGMKKTAIYNANNEDEKLVSENHFHLSEHNGSTHLDKFVFTLLAGCEESDLDALLNLLVRHANRKSVREQPEAEVHALISRFTRSVVRMFLIVVLLSPNAVNFLLTTISENISKIMQSNVLPEGTTASATPFALSSSVLQPTTTSSTSSLRESLQNYRAVAISGMLSLVRASLPGALGLTPTGNEKKDAKRKNVITFVAKCRRIFQTLLSYSLNELIGVADSLIAPVRNGILKPTAGSTCLANDDVLDLIQQHLNSENDLTTLLKEATEARAAGGNNRIRKFLEMRKAVENIALGQRTVPGNEENLGVIGVAGRPSPSEDELTNEEEEDDEEEGGTQNASVIGSFGGNRTRENSSTSVDRVHRERTISEQSISRRTRQQLQDAEMVEDISTFVENEEEEEEASSDDAEEDGDGEYFDVDDGDDDEGEDEDDVDSDDENPSDLEGGDSNDTATVTIGDANADINSRDGDLRTDNLAPAASATADTTSSSATIRNAEVGIAFDTSNAAASGNNNNGAAITTNPNTNIPPAMATTANRNGQNGEMTALGGWGTPGGSWSTAVGDGSRRSTVLRTSTTTTSTGNNSNGQPSQTTALEASSVSATPSIAVNTGTVSNQPTLSAVAANNNNNNSALETEDSGYSSNNTSAQLAMCYSVVVKVIDQLLFQLLFHGKYKQQLNRSRGITALLDLDEKLFGVFKELINESLEPTWTWLYLVMDRAEAQLKYGHAISKSLVGPAFNPLGAEVTDRIAGGEEQRREEQTTATARARRTAETTIQQRKYRRKSETKQSAAMVRTEFLSYFLALMRSTSAENGDDLPILEYSAYKNVAFVAEAYFFHIYFLDSLRQIELDMSFGEGTATEASSEGREEAGNQMEGHTMRLRKFYQRSNSISYPLLSNAIEHHAFTFTAADALPLATRAYLLSAEAERDSLFALPAPIRSRAAHREVASEHGVRYPTHQSLATPPLKYYELFQRLPTTDDPARSQTHTPSNGTERRQFTNNPMDNKSDLREEFYSMSSRLGLPSSAMQRCLGRWSNTVALFTKLYHEDLTNCYGGDSSHSILLTKTGVCSFNVRHTHFRKKMDRLKNTQTKDLIFSQMPREKYSLLQQAFRQMNQQYAKRHSGGMGTPSATGTPNTQQQVSTGTPPSVMTASLTVSGDPKQNPPLSAHKIKVTFRDEPGEGTGVARHFFAAMADALVSMKHLPMPDTVNEDGTTRALEPRGTPIGTTNTVKQQTTQSTTAISSGNTTTSPIIGRQTAAMTLGKIVTTSIAAGGSGDGSATATTTLIPSPQQDTQPLFYKASKVSGFYTPISGSCTLPRLNAFRNVGRLIGICLQHMEIIPLPLCRHVLKFILNRPITWFDLAFFDPNLFDSLRSIVYNEEKDEYHPYEFYEQLEMTFSVDLPAEEGGGIIELKPEGSNISVTKDNVIEYIYYFVENRLLGSHLPCLEAIRRGVFDVIPEDSLVNLTAEDLRLILCGSQEINIKLLQNFTKFLDESSASPDVLAKYKKTFWAVVDKLSNTEKQDLCFFWTGSPNIPSTEEGFQPLPTIMIRPADDHHLPTANTCISRLYLPLYSSRKILVSKLLLAIKARNFGFV